MTPSGSSALLKRHHRRAPMPTFRPTIGVLARAGDRFARDLFALLADRYDVELLDAPDPAVDLLWCDWADEALLAAAQEPAGPPVIARLHSHELFTGIPQQVRWERVDALVFVADHIRRRILPTLAIAPSKVHTIPNGLDLHRFSPGLHPGPLERIAWCGRLVAVKGVDLLVPVMERVRTVLPSATLHVAGAFEDERTAAGLRHAIEVAGLSDAIELCGPIEPDALPAWYRSHGSILSTSSWEAFQYTVAEGAACGLVPLVRAWPGADEVYGDAFHLWGGLDVLGRHLQSLMAQTPEALAAARRTARQHIATHYDRQRQVEATARLIEDVLQARRPVQVAGTRPRLTAALILKNEEARLPACLASIEGIVDEIVVVDTGSTDRTCAIAEAAGARVAHHPWQADFSLHRNQSLDMATGDWVLVIDGDEELRPRNLLTVLAAVHPRPEIDAITVRIDAMTEAGLGEQLEAVQLFRRGKCRYRYPVHNQLEGITGVVASAAAITAWYVGTLEQKAARSLPMLEALAERPDARAHAAFFLAKTWRALQRFDALRPWTRVCRQLVPADPGYATFWLWHIEAALLHDGWPAAEAALAEALTHHPDFTELHRFQVAFALQRWQSKAQGDGPYRALTVLGDRFARHIPAAATALGLPLEFRPRPPGEDSTEHEEKPFDNEKGGGGLPCLGEHGREGDSGCTTK
ncbi:MAG: glycosyltransferase [Myxococcales bacterium]|nr:glycosyltransferase [Myxococcales bacterium]